MVFDLRLYQHNATAKVENRFNIGSSGQQVHISCGPTDPLSKRHPCFKLSSREELEELKTSIYNHHRRGGPGAPMAADAPGELDSGKLIRTPSAHDLFADYRCRDARKRVSHAVLCERFCW